MIDKKTIAIYVGVAIVMLMLHFAVYCGDVTGGNSIVESALDRLGVQQQRTAAIVDGIDRGLESSHGTIRDIEKSNADFTSEITVAERINKDIAGSIGRGIGRIGRIEGIIDDSQRRIKACQRIISANTEKPYPGEKTE